MKLSPLYKGFLILCGLLLLANLLVMNEFTTVLVEGEAVVILDAQNHMQGFESSEEGLLLPRYFSRLNYSETGFNLFFLRLPGVLLLILAMMGFYWFGKKLFGQRVVLSALLVLSSSFLVIPIAKFVTYDTWLLAIQVMSFLFLILLLKQPLWKWRLLFWLSVIVGMLIAPVPTLLFAMLSWLFLMVFHRSGINIRTIYDFAFWTLVVLGVFGTSIFSPDTQGFILAFKQPAFSTFLLINILALLPWLGFLPAALWDMYKKLRKKDEMAIITVAWLVFGLISHGLIFQLALAFLIGKQVENYFKPNYPHGNLVKTFSILNLVISFFGVMALLLGGYAEFEALGFRSALGLSAVYWGAGFLAIIGLFSNSRKMIVGGITMSGTLAMLFFWSQMNPLLDNYRNLPKKLVYEVHSMIEKGKSENVFFKMGSSIPMEDQNSGFYDRLRIYANAKGIKLEFVVNMDSSGIYMLYPGSRTESPENSNPVLEEKIITGRNRILDTEQGILILEIKQ